MVKSFLTLAIHQKYPRFVLQKNYNTDKSPQILKEGVAKVTKHLLAQISNKPWQVVIEPCFATTAPFTPASVLASRGLDCLHWDKNPTVCWIKQTYLIYVFQNKSHLDQTLFIGWLNCLPPLWFSCVIWLPGSWAKAPHVPTSYVQDKPQSVAFCFTVQSLSVQVLSNSPKPIWNLVYTIVGISKSSMLTSNLKGFKGVLPNLFNTHYPTFVLSFEKEGVNSISQHPDRCSGSNAILDSGTL